MNLNAFRCLPIVTFLVFSNSVIPSTSVPLNKAVSLPLLRGDLQSRTETSMRRYSRQQDDSNSEDPTVADIVQRLLKVIACPNCRSKLVSLRLVTLFRELIRKSQQKLEAGVRYGDADDDDDDGSVGPLGMNETSTERLPPTAPSASQDILDEGIQPPRQDFRSFPSFPDPPHYGDGQESKPLVTMNASMSIANLNLASESPEVAGESHLQESSAVKEADYPEEEEELAINQLDPARHDDILFGLRRLGGPRRQRLHPKPRPTWPGMDRGLLPPIPDFPSLPNDAPPFPPPPNIAPPRPEGFPWDM